MKFFRRWLIAAGFILACSVEIFAASAAAPTDIRVRLLHTRSRIRLSADGPYNYMMLSTGKVFSASGEQEVRSSSRGFLIGRSSFARDVLVAPVSPMHFLSVNGRRYRGTLIFEPSGRGFIDVVNQLSLQDYLGGVLPREVGVEWPAEALKAQAVVSRTYALANKAAGPAQRFDVSNDVYSQVYGGMDDEAPTSNQAVAQTRGEILVDAQGKPIEAFFHSSCGGRTETPENVWKSAAASSVFESVPDRYCKDDPYAHWRLNISASKIRARLRRVGIRAGEIRKIKIASKTKSGRAGRLIIDTAQGRIDISGNKFRMALGPDALRSTLITGLRFSHGTFHFEGRGWGHGVGLCQWGARGRALAGQSYDKILSAYYPRATLTQVPAAPS